LLCELLRKLSEHDRWEAIKLTRGHYRSCGKDPQTCCVSDLLGEHPTVRSGREETYAFGKDTGRYWDSGAANVHWVIATDDQVQAGIQVALSRVKTPNVLIEGTSLLHVLAVDFAILVVGSDLAKPKASVRRSLIEKRINALYLPDEKTASITQQKTLEYLSSISSMIDASWLKRLPFLTLPDLFSLSPIPRNKM